MMPIRIALAACLLLTCGCSSAGAQAADPTAGRTAKIASELVALTDEYSAYLSAKKTGAFRPANFPGRIVDDRVLIDVVASGEADLLRSELTSIGMRHAVAFGRIVSGELPIAAIPNLAALASLKFARSAGAATHGGEDPAPAMHLETWQNGDDE
jgi:hypothetical protein